MNGRLPVPASTSRSHTANRSGTSESARPPAVSASSATGRSNGPRRPTFCTTSAACAAASSDGSKYWYAPRRMFAAFIADQFSSKRTSGCETPSLTRAMPKP